jgi:diguanylate cyclase (GGDEF)-like protein
VAAGANAMTEEKTIIADNVTAMLFAPNRRQKACLVQYSGTDLGKRYNLDQPELTIGRNTGNPIVVHEQSVSRTHAKLVLRDKSVEVEDMGSANGTFINEQKIEARTLLKDGDMLRLGTILFKFFAQGNLENVFHDKIYRMATFDATTQIFNKKYLQESLDSEFKQSRSYGRPLSLILYDLDFFKKVNDVHGHNAGDFILKESAQLVKSAIRKTDILGRFGGEEFVILLPDTDAKTAYELAEWVRASIEAHDFTFDGTVIKQTISLGVSQLAAEIADPKAFLESADQKMYQSKHGGRNRVTL